VDEPASAEADPPRKEIPRARILQAVDRLRPNYRVSFTLFHIQGRTYEEVAALMGVKRNDVRNYLFRARRILRKALANLEGGPA
jgi:RNA polymerase sigma-70 factor (ECF subfamily)